MATIPALPAVSCLLSTPELLEKILLSIEGANSTDTMKTIISTLRVSRAFHATFHGSVALQRAVFLQRQPIDPETGLLAEKNSLNPLFKGKRSGVKKDLSRRIIKTFGVFEDGQWREVAIRVKKRSVQRTRTVVELGVRFWKTKIEGGGDGKENVKPLWREMFLGSGIYGVSLVSLVREDGRQRTKEVDLMSPRMGQVYDLICGRGKEQGSFEE